jgi:LacI family transcriptional regulator
MIFERLDDPYYSRLVGASQVVATTNSSMLMVASPTPGVDQASLVRAFVQRGIDGLLIQPSSTDWEKEVVGGPPVVLFSRTLGAENFDAVVVDSFEGAYLATSHLISLGHRRIAVVDYGSSDPVGWTERFIDTRADRRRGYQEALRDAGIPEYPELIVLAGPTVKGASLAAQKIALSSNPPTAFFAMNNRMTVGVIAALGVRIDGFGLVGIDDFELADALVPQVTVVTQDPESLGTIGAELLFARIQSPNSPLIRIERPMKLIVRESGVGWRL